MLFHAIPASKRQLDVGPILVCDEDKPLGMVTDRDLVLQVMAEGLDTERVRVSDAASSDLVGVFRCCDGVSYEK